MKNYSFISVILKHPETGFDLVNVEKQIFIELKTDCHFRK